MCIFISIQGNQVAIKYIKSPVSHNFQKPSIIAEFNLVKFLMFSAPNQTFRFFLVNLCFVLFFVFTLKKSNLTHELIYCVPNHLTLFKTDERDETWEPGAVLWCLRWATERLFGHPVLQERQSEGQCTACIHTHTHTFTSYHTLLLSLLLLLLLCLFA